MYVNLNIMKTLREQIDIRYPRYKEYTTLYEVGDILIIGGPHQSLGNRAHMFKGTIHVATKDEGLKSLKDIPKWISYVKKRDKNFIESCKRRIKELELEIQMREDIWID